MRIEHIAMWVADLEKMKLFYETYFSATSNGKYTNPSKGFSSYFLSFLDGARLEIMQKDGIENFTGGGLGLAHFAIALGSKEKVNDLTERMRQADYKVVGEPRTTGDGYYESVIEDPEGNLVELTI